MYGNKDLWEHVKANDCTDPDCEVHNIDAALEEETIGYTELAFYFAGVFKGMEILNLQIDNAMEAAEDETGDMVLRSDQ